VRRAGRLVQDALEALVERAAPGVAEYELRGAAGGAILDGGGDIDFLIIGSTPMADPALVFGNPRPSQRVLAEGDIIVMELAAGYRGYSAQIGSPVCVGEPPADVRRFWDEIAKPGYELMAAEIGPGKPVEGLYRAGRFFREHGAQSRPIHAHGIDLVTDGPHVYASGVEAEPFEEVMRPGMVVMAEPNPITADGQLGMFVGHTFIVTEDGRECVDDFPVELVVTG
jgi:Xaa-Pro aminopeptidase